jgi:hypothetical protein
MAMPYGGSTPENMRQGRGVPGRTGMGEWKDCGLNCGNWTRIAARATYHFEEYSLSNMVSRRIHQ